MASRALASGHRGKEVDAVVLDRQRCREPVGQEHAAAAVDEDMNVLGKPSVRVEHLAGEAWVLIQHADLVNLLHAVYAREGETTWPKGKPPYGG